MMTPEFINHLMECKSCYAAAGRYCEHGRAFKIDSDAEFVCSLHTLVERRRLMETLKKSYPDDFELLVEKVKQKFELRRASAA